MECRFPWSYLIYIAVVVSSAVRFVLRLLSRAQDRVPESNAGGVHSDFS